MEKELLEAYRRIFAERKNEPEWAVKKHTSSCESEELVHCAIPFVGDTYGSQKTKILIYASAENLSWYINKCKEKCYLDNDEEAVNRHRNFFNSSKRDRFFPDVHIQPFNDGYLTIIALYIYLKYQTVEQMKMKPAEFLERISFANYGKYTIDSPKNEDYAKDPEKLAASHAYIEQDLKILRPDVIVMPGTIYNTDRDFVDRHKGNAEIIPIYQILPRTINSKKLIRKHDPADVNQLHSVVKVWYKQLKELKNNRTTENFLSVFTYLDGIKPQ